MSEKINKKNFLKGLLKSFRPIFIIILVIFLITRFIMPGLVRGDSMEPTLNNYNYVVWNCITYKFNEPKVGDIITFRATRDGAHEILIKRVIAVEGDTVEIRGGKVYINDVEVDQSYTKDKTTDGKFDKQTVPEDCVFCLGDNRLNSADSRESDIGFVHKRQIIGKVFVRLFPFTKIRTF